MEKTLLSRKTLSERWDFTSTKVIENYETDGIITRVPSLPTPRYSVDEIMKIETIGNMNPLSPLERRRLENRINKLEKELEIYKNKFENIKLQVI
ncbi:MAG: transcription factor [Clostridium sp.]